MLRNLWYNTDRFRKGSAIMGYCMIETAFDNLDESKKAVDILLKEKLVGSCHRWKAIANGTGKTKLKKAKNIWYL